MQYNKIKFFFLLFLLYSCSNTDKGIEGDDNTGNNVIVGNNNTISVIDEEFSKIQFDTIISSARFSHPTVEGATALYEIKYLTPKKYKDELILNKLQSKFKANFFNRDEFIFPNNKSDINSCIEQQKYDLNEYYKKNGADYGDDYKQMANWEYKLTAEILQNSNQLLSYKIDLYSYMGGNSPHYPARFFTYDLKNFKLLELNDLFRNYEHALKKELIRVYEKQFGENSFFAFNSDDVELLEASFYISNNRICFTYDKYAIACGADGRVVLCIKLEDIQYLIDDTSPLQRIVDNV